MSTGWLSNSGSCTRSCPEASISPMTANGQRSRAAMALNSASACA